MFLCLLSVFQRTGNKNLGDERVRNYNDGISATFSAKIDTWLALKRFVKY
jgi:hypothetical protein